MLNKDFFLKQSHKKTWSTKVKNIKYLYFENIIYYTGGKYY